MGMHFDRGQALFELKRYQEAIVEYQQELAEQSGCVYSKANIASCLINLGRLTEAREAVRETLALAPEYGFAFYLLSFLEPKGGGDSPALRAIDEAVRLEPTVVRNVVRRGWLLREQGRHAECLETTTRALELDPRNVDALVLRAKALEALGRPDDAAATLREALVIDPEDPDAHLALGNVALACGDPAEALDALREARRISPVKHNNREKILDALARRIWPFRQIDALMKWWRRRSPVVRWAVWSAVFTSLLLLHAVVRPTNRYPSPPLTVLYLLLVNGLLFLVRAPQYSKLVVRVLKRREIDLRRTTVLSENIRMMAWLAFSHWMASVAAIMMSFSPGFSYFTLTMAMIVASLLALPHSVRERGKRRLGEGEKILVSLLICLTPTAYGTVAFVTQAWALAWGIWVAVLACTGLAAWYRQRVACRRLG